MADKTVPMITDANVILADIAYPAETLHKIAATAASLVILDHHDAHESAIEDIVSYPPLGAKVSAVFDKTKCAAEIAADYVGAAPWWLKYVRDCDLWLWEHKRSRHFMAALRMEGIAVETFAKISQFGPGEIGAFMAAGADIAAADARAYTTIAAAASVMLFRVDRRKYRVAVVQSSVYQSDVGAILAARPGVEFAVVYRYDMIASKWFVSLRGNGKTDLNKIAAHFGGGGSSCAAGFSITSNISNLFSLPTARKAT